MRLLILCVGSTLFLLACSQSAAPGRASADVAAKPLATAASASAPAVACDIKVQTINICTDGDCYSIGLQKFSIGTSGAELNYAGGSLNQLWMFRSFTEAEKADPLLKGLATGKAYTRLVDKTYQYVCDVDTKLTDAELWARMGHVDTK
jgi:hypothetical protein